LTAELLEFTTVPLELDCTSAELLDTTLEEDLSPSSLRLELLALSEVEVELDEFEASSLLLLDSIPPSGVLDDEDVATFDEDFAEELDFALLDDPRSTEEDDSTPGSSLGPEDEESSPQAANNIAVIPTAIRNFFIKPPIIQYNKSKINVNLLTLPKRAKSHIPYQARYNIRTHKSHPN
jgi:hypothetical protein